MRSPSLPRKVALRLRPGVREITERDIRIPFWAGYRLGAFGFEPGMNADEFEAALAERVQGWDGAVTLEVETREKEPVVGLMILGISEHRMVPHVFWMPWARSRDKIAAILKFFIEFRKDYGILVPALEEDEDFFRFMARYGVLRRVGFSRQWYRDERVVLFEST